MTSEELPNRIILMGISGSGKSSIGRALAPLIDAVYKDGDVFHSESNIEKMDKGIPLTDDDRWPWLAKVGEVLAETDGRAIVGCSALKRSYRDAIRKTAGDQAVFVHLTGSRELITERMKERTGHFMPVSLLDSQLEDLEVPEEDERAVTVDISPGVDEIAQKISESLYVL